VLRNFRNIPGSFLNRKVVIIESDDWGSIRMPSKPIYDSLKKAGIDIETGDNYRYNKYDTLASSDDLELLFDVLSAVKDKTGRPAVITPMSLVANPDFIKIKESRFQDYFYEPFTETLKRQKGCENSFKLWEEGINKRLFVPQFHGREHLNVNVWLRDLQENDLNALIAFDHGTWGFNNCNAHKIFYQAAFELNDPAEIAYHRSVIKDGLQLFEKLHGYKARYFVPPNGPVNNGLLETASENGIKYVLGSGIQRESMGNGKVRKHIHWLGQKTKYGQHYILRNCSFEPSLETKDWVDSCMDEIKTAFKWRKPAIISSHRVNFIGELYPENRDRGLRQLKLLLDSVVKTWPDVEFMTSNELGDLIAGQKSEG
jgi:hypothetical protein